MKSLLHGALRAYARSASRASSGGTLRSTSSSAKATEDCLPAYSSTGLRSLLSAKEGKRSWLILGIFILGLFTIISSSFLSTSKASPTSVTWTTKGDFENNAVTTNTPTTKTNVKVTGSAPADDADVTLTDPSPRVVTTIDNIYAKGVAVNSNTNRIYISHAYSDHRDVNYVTVFDGTTNAEIAKIDFGFFEGYLATPAINAQTNEIYVPDSKGDTVWVINGNDNSIITNPPINVGDYPCAAAIDEARNQIYIVNQYSNNVSIIDGASKNVIATIPVGTSPRSTAVCDDKVYVTNGTSLSVSVINCVDNTVNPIPIPVGRLPWSVAANPTTHKVYVANYMSQSVSVIDSFTDGVIKTIDVYYPKSVAVNPLANKIYVSYSESAVVLDGNDELLLGNLDFRVYAINTATEKFYATVYGGVSVAYSSYPASGTISGLKINAGGTAKWQNLTFNTTTPPGTSVEFEVRGADTEGELASKSWNKIYGSPNNLEKTAPISKWLEIRATLTASADGLAAPTLHDFNVTYEPVTLTSRDCTTCHATKYPSDQFDQYSETNNVTLSGCTCHKGIANESFHTNRYALYSTPYGNFKTAASIYSDSSTIHAKHVDEHMNTPGNCNQSGCHHDSYPNCSYTCHGSAGVAEDCKKCHYTADCSTCHQNDVPHGTPALNAAHGNTAPRSSTVSNGSTYYSKNLSCLNDKCHKPTFGTPAPGNHDSTDGSLVLAPLCLNCHPVGGKDGHGDVTLIHTYSGMTTSCLDCHSNVLTTEHANRGHDCWVCHGESASQTVKDAIASNDVRCTGTGACHGGEEGKMSGPPHNPHTNYNTFSNICRACHKVHQAQGKKITRKAPEIEICYICHDGSGSTYNIRASYENLAAHDTHLTAPEASNIKCVNCHHPHGATAWPSGGIRMTRASEEELCYTCHSNPANSENGIDIEERFTSSSNTTSHHDVTDADQASSGSKVECRNCHNTHIDNRTNKVIDPDNRYASYTATRLDSTSYSGIIIRNVPATQDTEIKSGSPNTNFEGGEELTVGYSTNASALKQRSLIKFNLSSIPAGATIVGAYLFIANNNQDSAAMTLEAHALTQDWTPTSVTWNSRDGVNLWTTAGGTYAPQPAASKNLPADSWTKYPFDITQLVSQWHSGMPNYGVILLAPGIENGGTEATRYICATEFLEPLFCPPTLVVEYYISQPTLAWDSVSFCLKCHDGSPPAGVTVPAGVINIGATYLDPENGDVHGARPGEGSLFGSYQVPIAPYHFGMPPLACEDCHDPHGSSNVYHLREEVNGKSGISVTNSGGVGAMSFCTACHQSPHPPEASGYDPDWACFTLCHRHGAKGGEGKPDF